MKTDYEGHERVYRQRKTEGYVGWAKDETVYDEYITAYSSLKAHLEPAATKHALELGCGAGNITVFSLKIQLPSVISVH